MPAPVAAPQPKYTRRKFEVATGELYNPIKQDTRHGILREYTYGDMCWNYGMIPQTYEDPARIHALTGLGGDRDPLDVVELGARQLCTGAVVPVKVLGVLAMVDEGETDFKLLAISTLDPLAAQLHDVADVEAHLPGAIAALRNWLTHYKAPSVNTFANGGEPVSARAARACALLPSRHRRARLPHPPRTFPPSSQLGRAFAHALLDETHEAWRQLVAERGGHAVVAKEEAAAVAAAAVAAGGGGGGGGDGGAC